MYLYMCFIDYTKAFDKVGHEQLFDEVSELDLYGKDLRLLQDLYWNQTACIRIDGECSSYTKNERGVRQGCVMSPDLFNYYSELILRELDKRKGLRVDLQKLLDIVVRESERKCLSINCKKTECLVV